ncbi:MAG: trypsin-like peptidase domain-containing protein, partial [bacterium]
ADGKATTLGSGVVVAPGLVITNRHVIKGGVSFRVEHDGKKWPARLVRVDPDHDLAELSVAGLSASPAKLRDSSKLAVGEKVYAIGSPEGLELTISEGLISGLRDFDGEPVIQTSAAISPGSSGGGLFDAEGRLVGITTFYLKEGQSLNFALPAEWTVALNRRPEVTAPVVAQASPAFQALVWSQRGVKAYEANQYDVAAHAFQEVIRLKPDDEGAWVSLGAAYDELGQHDKAASAEREAIRLKPDDEGAWFVLGYACHGLGQYDKEIGAEQEAIRLKPDDEPAWHNLGLAYDELGQYDKAANAEQEAVRLKPNDARAWFLLGVAYYRVGQQSGVI